MALNKKDFLGPDNNPYTEGDLSSPEEKFGVGSALLAAAVGIGLTMVAYRGARGAGFYPGSKKFWSPLTKDIVFKKPIRLLPKIKIGKKTLFEKPLRGITSVKTQNVKSLARKATEISQGRPFSKTLMSKNKQRLWMEKLEENVGKISATGYGLRGPKESIAHLYSRTIEAIPDFVGYAGFAKTSEKLKAIPKWILGGTPSELPGFSKAPDAVKRLMVGTGFKPGARGPLNVIGRVATRVMLPAYIATVGYNYLDYRVRRSKALDKTPLREGITTAGAGMWVKSRMFMQETLDNLGVLDFHKHTQTLFPGYLKAAGMIAGVVSGMKATQPFGSSFANTFVSSLIMGFAGGVAGYATEKALSYSPKQLKRIYSGEEKVPVRKGRWWEFGRTPFEGGKIDYYKPHWYPLMRSRYKEKGTLYPSEDWKWQNHWLIGRLTGNKVDPYAWEKKYYKERPYPITSGAFEDVPLIGPTLDATLGKLIKPRKLMHTEEWLGKDGPVEQPDETSRIRRMPVDTSTRLGLDEIPRSGMGEIISPTDIRHRIGEQLYRTTEWMGLPGFYTQEALRAITGRESLFEQARLQSPSRATGAERNYWDRSLGGLLGSTEIFRRFFPHRRRQIEEYNPIPNLMGKEHPWVPGSDYFVDFKHGDPFTKVPLGEARLPGTGYEALNELHSNIPGVYDPVDRYLILADVAPYSNEFKNYRTIVNAWMRSGVIDKTWREKVYLSREQREARMERYEFQPRSFSKVRKQVDEALTQANEGEKYSAIERKAATAWENLAHIASNTPLPGLSYLTSKIMPVRTPIEHYERFQVFGRESASWGQPIRDFAKVYYQEARGKIQPNWIPPDVEKKREIEDYFDKLEYVKYKQLAKRAREVEDEDIAEEFDDRSKETMHGLNPYGSWSNIFRAMPSAERSYFMEFSKAKDEERERIKEIVPDYMERIYEAQWQLRDRKKPEGTESTRIEKQTNEDLSDFFAKKYLPSPNWLGWHPDVDLEKVKLKVVKNEALDIHDFNLWRQQEEETKKEPIPFIRDFRTPNPQYDTPVLRRELIEMLTEQGFNFPEIEISTQPSDKSRVNIDFDVSYDQSNRFEKFAQKTLV